MQKYVSEQVNIHWIDVRVNIMERSKLRKWIAR